MDSEYLLQGGQAGAARLETLAEVHRPATEWLFDRIAVGLPAGGRRCLDVGCGIGMVTRLLAERFARGSGGSVVGVDIDAHHLDLARARDADLAACVRYERSSVHELTFSAEFDLVYSRFVLSHVKEPREALRRMALAARPGGVIAVEDVDFAGAFCHPPSPDFERYLAWYDEMSRGNGANPSLGRELFAMVRDLGVAGVELNVSQPTSSAGPGKRLALTTLEHIGHELVARKIAPAAEVSRVAAGLRAFVEDPGTILSMPRIFQVWGRAP